MRPRAASAAAAIRIPVWRRPPGPRRNPSGLGCMVCTSIVSGSGVVITFSSLDVIAFSVNSSLNWFGLALGQFLGNGGIAPSVKQTEDGRHKDQSGHSGAQQATNDGAPERRILLAPLAQPEGHGNHADDHGQSGHENGAKP